METRDIVRIALFAAVIGALGILPKFDLPIAGGVPVTAQSLGVMLAGIFLGPRKGALAALLFVFLVTLGLPLLAGGRGGLGVLYGPSAGFFIGFIPAALVCGLMMEGLTRLPVFARAIVAGLVGGIAVMYALGIPLLAWRANMSLAQAAVGSMVFLPGDVIKAVIAGFVAEAVCRSAPKAIAGR